MGVVGWRGKDAPPADLVKTVKEFFSEDKAESKTEEH
jgi:hypothetical protein